MKTNENEIKNDIFIFRYDPHSSFEGMFEEFWEAVDGKKLAVEPNVIRSNSIEALAGNMNKNRLRMFEILIEKKPTSIMEWASLLQKHYTVVRADAKILEGMGLIKLEKLSKKVGNRKGGSEIEYGEIKPIPLYKRIVFDFPIMENISVIGKKVINGRSQTLQLK